MAFPKDTAEKAEAAREGSSLASPQRPHDMAPPPSSDNDSKGREKDSDSDEKESFRTYYSIARLALKKCLGDLNEAQRYHKKMLEENIRNDVPKEIKIMSSEMAKMSIGDSIETAEKAEAVTEGLSLASPQQPHNSFPVVSSSAVPSPPSFNVPHPPSLGEDNEGDEEDSDSNSDEKKELISAEFANEEFLRAFSEHKRLFEMLKNEILISVQRETESAYSAVTKMFTEDPIETAEKAEAAPEGSSLASPWRPCTNLSLVCSSDLSSPPSLGEDSEGDEEDSDNDSDSDSDSTSDSESDSDSDSDCEKELAEVANMESLWTLRAPKRAVKKRQVLETYMPKKKQNEKRSAYSVMAKKYIEDPIETAEKAEAVTEGSSLASPQRPHNGFPLVSSSAIPSPPSFNVPHPPSLGEDNEGDEEDSDSNSDEEKELTNAEFANAETQRNHYEAFRRSGCHNSEMDKMLENIKGTDVRKEAILSVTKVFIGDLIETARVIMAERNDSGPIKPDDIAESYRRLVVKGKTSESS